MFVCSPRLSHHVSIAEFAMLLGDLCGQPLWCMYYLGKTNTSSDLFGAVLKNTLEERSSVVLGEHKLILE